jgi:polyhydroxyalkanoate synthase subunit PhaC
MEGQRGVGRFHLVHDWTAWIGDQGGDKVAAPDQPGNDVYPPLEPAPGTCVRGTA